MACDMIIAAREAQFAQPEVSLGVMPDWGGSYRLAMLIGPNRAKEMFFTGKMISADQGYNWGLINHVCSKEEIDEAINHIVSEIKKNDTKVLGYVKEIINRHTKEGVQHNTFEETTTSAICMTSLSTQQRSNNFFAARKG